jgi:malonate-semialdehyde dehydrogenase (acetylating)/methylmalonate-semialdehyde dehydrogenase
VVKVLRNFIGGEWAESKSGEYRDIINPATGEILAKAPNSTPEEIDEAVRAAAKAFKSWRDTPVPDRVQPLFEFASYLKKNQVDIAIQITKEHGKTLEESKGEVLRSWQYVEHACGAPDLMKGEMTIDVARGIAEYTVREPLGVFVFMGPYNFPLLTSIYWVWAVACGNTVVVKAPSETPCTINKVFEECVSKVFPKGVVNLVNCSGSRFTRVFDFEEVKGLTFVGSSAVGKYLYELAAKKGKRVQCLTGAKNCAVVMPDADYTSEAVMGNLLRAIFGNTGQRCFAVSRVLVMEEIYEDFKRHFVEEASKLKVGYGLEEGVEVGPVTTRDHLERLLKAIEKGIEDGAKLLLDGRNVKVEKYPNGNWLGPTIFEVEPSKRNIYIFEEELFGPIACLTKVKSLDEAIEIVNSGKYGHSAVIYTENGYWADYFVRNVDVGQVGINVGTPAPIGFYPLGGRRESFYGSTRARGRQAIEFYTDPKVVIRRWFGRRRITEWTWMERI